MKLLASNLALLLVTIHTTMLVIAVVRQTDGAQHEYNMDKTRINDGIFHNSAKDQHELHFEPETEYTERKQDFLAGSEFLKYLTSKLFTHTSLNPVHNSLVIGNNSKCWSNKSYVDCSNAGLHCVPTIKFSNEIKVYDLSQNYIESLPGHAFSDYPLLKKLDLRKNRISEIHPLAFIGLTNLEFLDLSSNNLEMNETVIQNSFSSQVFVPLKNLKKLRLERNNPHPNDTALRYPHEAFSHLASLEELCLDGFTNVVFESGFANLTQLRNLSLDGYRFGHCQLHGLSNKTFENLKFLEYLSITQCYLLGHRIEAGTFSPLKHLVTLNISHNQDINVQFFDRVFYGLQNTKTLKTLNMQFVVNLYTLGVCLSSKYIQYFPQSIENLVVSENKLECIDRQVIDKIKNSLKTIDISRNNFVFGSYLLDLPKLKGLTGLYLDNFYDYANRLPRIYPYNPETPPLDTTNCSLYEEGKLTYNKFILRLPPKLAIVRLRYLSLQYIFSRLEVETPNSLKTLHILGNYIPVLMGPVLGLEGLRTFDLATNKVSYIIEEFFQAFPSLENLNLSSNQLGEFFNPSLETKCFQPLTKLKILDLSSNAIRGFGRYVFHGLKDLRVLIISHNPIQRFHADISSMKKLHRFVAVDTNLPYLSRKTRVVISNRIQRGLPFYVNLQESPISCICENLPFLKWMVTSKAFNFKQKKYLCSYAQKSSREITDGYQETLKTLSRQCFSDVDLLIILAVLTNAFLVGIVFSLFYRYRWKLLYWYYKCITHSYLRSGRNASIVDRFEYDVQLCYAEEDIRFVIDMLQPALDERRLSVFVRHRHFTAGDLISSNIIRAVQKCRRTLVVLTRKLADTLLFKFELQMAYNESKQRRSPVMIFLLLDDMTAREMGQELLYYLKNNKYHLLPSESNRNEAALKALWDKLARDIRR
ncbi:Toll-like receptor f [Elysia marginata]|uniref:Toll-like receptor f n=1 Tax=Elysia marginata TaxID=1093978 RepID=A0AAV4HE78_9GAST|nr:Toll-like receptor f [Elysia marginata]